MHPEGRSGLSGKTSLPAVFISVWSSQLCRTRAAMCREVAMSSTPCRIPPVCPQNGRQCKEVRHAALAQEGHHERKSRRAFQIDMWRRARSCLPFCFTWPGSDLGHPHEFIAGRTFQKYKQTYLSSTCGRLQSNTSDTCNHRPADPTKICTRSVAPFAFLSCLYMYRGVHDAPRFSLRQASREPLLVSTW